ncbi:hypothetical protein EYF80_020829 [Liparis tanakae]|uniref:Uncharacterized protein n=1 Tax=Liparis tanakae TaxID=230148 RepID=A0A4Z2HT92_9TELE|nr:hypothetical protein EYF80_020829 [Liparis tanakae]
MVTKYPQRPPRPPQTPPDPQYPQDPERPHKNRQDPTRLHKTPQDPTRPHKTPYCSATIKSKINAQEEEMLLQCQQSERYGEISPRTSCKRAGPDPVR